MPKPSTSNSSQHTAPSTPPRSREPRATGSQGQHVLSEPVKDTPRSAKGHVGTVGQNKIRPDIAQQMTRELLQCSLEDFLKSYVPFVPTEAAVDATVSHLKYWMPAHGSWRGFEGHPPSKVRGNENTVFAKLKPIINALARVPCSDQDGPRNPTFHYMDTGNTLVKGEIPGSSFRVDACLSTSSYKASPSTMKTYEMALIAEFKKSSDTEKDYDDRLKVVSAANHIMNDDPRRMWMYGVWVPFLAKSSTSNTFIARQITIEDGKMAVWYFSRSHSVKSDDFDFTKDRRTFLRVFMSFLFAREREMGFDPAVRRVPHGDESRYIYTIRPTLDPPRHFRTIKPIFNPRLACITGRKTRVWEAEEVHESSDTAEVLNNGGKKFALKDVWLDEGSRPEKEIQDLIIERLKDIAGARRDWPEGYLGECITAALTDFPSNLPFMKIECDGWGEKCGGRHDKAEPNSAILQPPPIVPTYQQSAKLIIPGSSQISSAPTTSSGHSSPAPVQMCSPRRYLAKRQYRLVYQDVGFALHDSKDLKVSFNAIRDILVGALFDNDLPSLVVDDSPALTLLFLAGWVHRDISTGNIIIVRAGNTFRGLLSDFEYAKEIDRADEPKSDPKTGTPFFMPLEIHLGYTIAHLVKGRGVEDRKDRVRAYLDYRPGRKARPAPPPTRQAPLKFQHHHDLESLMWIALWFLICQVRPAPLIESGGPNQTQLGAAIFTNTPIPSFNRQQLFTNRGLGVLQDAFHPNLGDDFFNSFAALHTTLLDFCVGAVSHTTEDFEMLYEDVWVDFGRIIDAVVEAEGIELEMLSPDSRPQPQELSEVVEDVIHGDTSQEDRNTADLEEEAKSGSQILSQSHNSANSKKRKASSSSVFPPRLLNNIFTLITFVRLEPTTSCNEENSMPHFRSFLSPLYFLLTNFVPETQAGPISETSAWAIHKRRYVNNNVGLAVIKQALSMPVTPPGRSDTQRSAKGDLGVLDQHKIRSEIGEQMAPELLRCTIDVFLSHYAPFDPQDDHVESVITTLKKKNHLMSDGRWHPRTYSSLFKPRTKSSSTKTSHGRKKNSESEAAVFGKLTQIVDDMAPQGDTNNGRTRRFFYTDCGSRTVEGEIQGGGFKPDAFVLQSQYDTGKITLSDAAVVGEFKKSDDPKVTRDNRLKVISAAGHIMNNDPRRMWTYGISIEKDMMSVWYFSRSHSVKADEFNWVKDPWTFIKVFVSFLFAKELEIGFDPSVRRVTYRTKERFIYEIKAEGGTRYYRTIKPIFNPRVACITGRKTVEVVEKGKRVALKDVWLDEGSQTERQIQKAIFDKLKQVRDEDYEWADGPLQPLIKEALTNFPRNLPFIEIQCDEWGTKIRKCHAEAVTDSTIIPRKRYESSVAQNAKYLTTGTTQYTPPVTSEHPNPVPLTPRHRLRDYAVKQQYRLVYSSVGYALHDAKDLSTSFKAIKDVFIALVLLFLAGWVHRDVSAGNIIIVGVDGRARGLLSDLEHAKEFNRERGAATNPKMACIYFQVWQVTYATLPKGTPFFMPIEIHDGSRLKNMPRSHLGPDMDVLWPVYQFHHDLESLAWVGFWTGLGKVQHSGSHQVFYWLFTNGLTPSQYRSHFFKGYNRQEVLNAFHPDLRDTGFSSTLIGIQAHLHNLCISLSDEPEKRDFYCLYQTVSEHFFKLAQIADEVNNTVKFIPSPRNPLSSDNDSGKGPSGGHTKGKGKADARQTSSRLRQASTSREWKDPEPLRRSARLRERNNTN
ncbi:hypothetical protein D9756_001087 [Leucocoprinus leucothites]|uniref:Fungal-type protein kinase domain-containing protein n=1 Tax=Leucocoprinus leucothites TaxID=201217 RepID=A0A8H5LNS0_9AGAR|nr:hypothetical protein D9756_001087 [Leucoagaricus leucothites]